MNRFLWVALGGILGSLSRFIVVEYVQKIFPSQFPYGTLAVNVSGCMIAGFIMEMIRRHPSYSDLKYFAVIGFLGAFTTFSTFSLESIQLLKEGYGQAAFLNIAGSFILCFLAVWLGQWSASVL